MTCPDYTNSPHYVYVCIGRDGRAVYVGCTVNLAARMESHRSSAFWARDVIKVRATVHPNKAAGLAVERDAIRDLQPRFNRTGRWGHRQNWTVADYDDYILARQSARWGVTSWVAGHLLTVQRERELLVRRELQSDVA